MEKTAILLLFRHEGAKGAVFMNRKLLCRRLEMTAVLTLIFALLAAAIPAERAQKELAEDVLRLRVVACSDSEEDQSVKYAVRDAMLAAMRPLSQQAKDAGEMRQLVDEHLPELVQIAQNTVQRCGSDADVSATLAFEHYPTRDYGAFALPAGDYQGLQIRIGKAQGKNWWCVLYPSLCVDMAGGEEQLTEEETALIERNGTRYQIRFAAAEVLGELRTLF